MTTVPTFLVAGAARSGTTGLVEGLRAHPQVFVTQPKEPHYFALHGGAPTFQGPGDENTINRSAVTDRAGYLNLFPAEHEYLALGDGSVSTLYYAEHALAEIQQINPQMRVVVILRDPVERAYSSYSYLRSRGFEPHDSFCAALADEPRRRSADWHHLWHYTGMSYYAHGLRILREGLGVDQVGVWFYDDLERDFSAVVSSVLRFLDVPSDINESAPIERVNVSGTPRNVHLQRVIWWASRHDGIRRSAKSLTSFAFRERVRRTMLRSSNVPQEAREYLTPLFQDDLREVSAMIGSGPGWLARHA